MNRLLISMGELFPPAYLKGLEQNLEYADLEFDALTWAGGSLLLSTIIAPVSAVVGWYILQNPVIAAFLGMAGFLLGIGLTHTLLLSLSDKRAQQVEVILPDALLLVSANIRSGLTPDRAIWASARPEFGFFEKELRSIGRETFTGTMIEDALLSLTKKIRSNILVRTVRLINEGLRSGGELAYLLENIASDIRTSQMLKKEISASVMMYTIFISFACLLGAPLLFAISTFFVEMTSKMGAGAEFADIAAASAVMGGGFGGFASNIGSISLETIGICPPALTTCEPISFLVYYAAISIAITTVFGALMIGVIQHGKALRGLKLVPVFSGAGLGVFFLTRMLVTRVFGSLL